jgi:hypothetical protein
MVQKMSLDFFYNHPTKGESDRAQLWQFFVQLSIWSVQTTLGSVVPLIPWSQAQDWLLYKVSECTGKCYDQTGRLDKFGDLGFDRWRGDVLEHALGDLINLEDGWLVSPGYHNPTMTTLADWFRVNADKDRQWQRFIYGEQVSMSQEAVDAQLWTHGSAGLFPEFRQRWNTQGFAAAVRNSAADLQELTMGTIEKIQGRWWWLKNSVHNAAVNKVPWLGRVLGEPDTSLSWLDHQRNRRPEYRLPAGEDIVSWGPMEEWRSQDQWRMDRGESAVRLVDEIWGHRVAAPFDWKQHPIATTCIGATNLTLKLDKWRAGMARLYPVAANMLMPMYLRDVFGVFTFAGTDKKHDHNSANLVFMLQESGRYARRLIKENVNSMFSSPDVGDEGATHISNALIMGSYLPADRGSLHDWTDATVEDMLTKNMFFRTLNGALQSQKHFISCTPDLVRKVRNTNLIIDPFQVSVKTCVADNTGPDHLRQCIPATASEPEMVCYMYRWADRGVAASHHVENPYGWEKYSSYDLTVQDIIQSSWLTRRAGLSSKDTAMQLFNVQTLAWGPTSAFVTDPSTPGMFRVPVCVSPYNWNGHTTGYSWTDDISLYSAKKSLPCYCGAMGNETQAVWSAMRLDISGRRGEYLTMLCPRQIAYKIKNPLERYVAKCRLGIKKVGKIHHQHTDHLCDVVIHELKQRGVEKIEDVTDEQTFVAMCKIKQGWSKIFRSECWRWNHTPFSRVWDEAEILRKEGEGKAKGLLEKAETKRQEDLGIDGKTEARE